MTKRLYDSTVARIAGNIASGLASRFLDDDVVAERSVRIARAIVAEVERTESPGEPDWLIAALALLQRHPQAAAAVDPALANSVPLSTSEKE